MAYGLLLTLSIFLGQTVPQDPSDSDAPALDIIVKVGQIFLDQALLDQVKADEALLLFESGLQATPENPDLLILAGRAALLAGKADRSVTHLFQAVRQTADSFEANLYLGMALREQGLITAGDLTTQNEGYMLIEDALGFLQKAENLQTQSTQASMELARTYYDLFDLEKASQAADRVLQRAPCLLEALLLRGDLAYSLYRQAAGEGLRPDQLRERWAEAMGFYEKAAVVDPQEAGAFLGQSALYEAIKKPEKAIDTCIEALICDPERIQAYNRLLALFDREEKPEGLLVGLNTVVETVNQRFSGNRSRLATPLYYLGFAYLEDNEAEKSIEAFKESAALREDYRIGAFYQICKAECVLGEYDRAVEVLFQAVVVDREKLIAFMQDDGEFREKFFPRLFFLAFHLFEGGRRTQARDLSELLLEVVQDDAKLYNNYALLCRETGRYEEAYEAYRGALNLDPTNPNYLNDTALILHYHLHRDLDEAERLYQKAIKEAKKILDESKGDKGLLNDVKTALRDARNNLRSLRAGKLREDPDGR